MGHGQPTTPRDPPVQATGDRIYQDAGLIFDDMGGMPDDPCGEETGVPFLSR